MNTWFSHALLIRSTSTSYDQTRDFQICKSIFFLNRQNLKGVTFANVHTLPINDPWRLTCRNKKGLGTLFKSHISTICPKMRSILFQICFRLSIWPNGHRESQKCEFVRGIGRTNVAAGLIISPSNSAQNHTWFPHAPLIRSRKYMN
jgi:hypothetical protein